jgi:hypothetical protein
MNFESKLREEILNEIEHLGTMALGSEEYKMTVDGVTKLMDKAIELEKINIESQDRIESRDIDVDLRTKQMKDEQTDRWIRNSITVAGILIPTFVTIWGTVKTIEFEKEGTITTIMGRGFINKLLPKK